MSYLVTVFPPVERLTRRLPLTRDQFILSMAAINQLFLSVDIYLAHSINGTLKSNEWIPIIFGFVAGVLLLLAGVIAFKQRPLATILANLIFLGSIIVGLMGVRFHLARTVLLTNPQGQAESVNALVWAPPVLGPLFFVLIGVLGISAAWIESPPDSGRLLLLGKRSIQMPYSKTRAYFLIVGIMILATLISSVLDHTRINLQNPWVWLPLAAGLFGTAVAISLGFIAKPTRGDLTIYAAAMIMLILVGLIGALLHIHTNLIPRGTIIVERFLRGSPLLAPLLFANVGLLGLLALLDPREKEL
jgi:hypothetical protein